ncbi:hypothetical protein [Clostridium sp. D53t1_180928_C8]|uniref:hypothetical protein n=1 Tax=Clostridium sp. D53t1_180928_C8 TaxID=2787101 RepID=UPI0018A9172A|nr:hypothetical protein [Clostridium sp. D53t1_180928_C8]
MSKIHLQLKYKNILILKHSLEQRIERDKEEYEGYKYLKQNHELTDEGVAFIKEHEDHIRCYEALIEEMSRCEMHGRNIFGGK